jgi:hypothetical protein
MHRSLIFAAALVCFAQTGAAGNACELLTKKDLAAVQGEAFTATKLTETADHSQCFYQLPTFSKSVSVVIISGKGRDYWKANFENARGEEGEAEEVVRVRGVGDEAVWSGNHLVGALYVLRRDKIVRISVGGPGTKAQKIAKARRLGVRALSRL